MAQIFISHVEENADAALGIADGLEEVGYRTWCYERDALPGPSYLLQTSREIEESSAVVLLISPDSLGSRQVTAEVVRAHESGRPFIPVLIGISHVEFAARQPEWREALGSATSIALPPDGANAVLPRIRDGLRGLGILPDEDEPPAARVYTAPRSAPAAATATTAAPALRAPAPSRRMLAGIGAGGVALLLIAVAVVTLGGGGGGGGEEGEDTTRTVSPPVSVPGASTGDEQRDAEQFRSTADTALATSAGSMRVVAATLTQNACPPRGIPGGCLTATGSDQYVVVHLVPASGGSAALTQVFTTEAHSSSLRFGGGLQAGSYRVSLDESANRVEVVYGVLSGSAADDDVLIQWPGNQSLILVITK